MTHAEQDVSVVICAHSEDRWDDLLAAVASVRQQRLPAREILVVADHNPRLFERARAELPGALVLEYSEQKELSGARHTVGQAAQGELIAFLAVDGIAAPDWVTVLSKPFMYR